MNPAPAAQHPGAGRLWILPNRNSLGLGALLLAMGYAGASQTNAAAYLLGFTLASLALVSSAHAWANLRGLHISADPIPPAFLGEKIQLRISVAGGSRLWRRGIRISAGGSIPKLLGDIAPGCDGTLEIGIPAAERGRHRSIPVVLSSVFPLGFLTASQRWKVPATHYIYPAPAGVAPLPAFSADAAHLIDGRQFEGDDFSGVRPYRPGESQRHIDWKAVARGQPLLTKQWTSDAAETFIFDWANVPAGDTESRLSQIARWIIQAERTGDSYGLRLPGHDIPIGAGERHYHCCLRALAVFLKEESP